MGNHKIVSPVAGAVVAVGLYLGLGWLWLAIPAGLVAWGALYVMMAPEGAFDPRKRKIEETMAGVPEQFRKEIADAEDRIKAVRKTAYAFPGDEPIRDDILKITEHAKAILEDVQHQPKDYNRMRKALTHYLGHVETIAGRLTYLRKQGGDDPELMERSRATVKDLVGVFEQYRSKMLEDEVFDIDARIALLEQEIGGEDIVAKLKRDQAARAAGSGSDGAA